MKCSVSHRPVDTVKPADIRRCVSSLLAELPEIRIAFLFGSCASGRATASSDIDLAVAADHRLTLDERLELAARVARATRRDADVIDLRAVNGVILQQALCRGVPILVRDKQLFAALMKRMFYNQADYMPYYRRLLAARRKRFLHGY